MILRLRVASVLDILPVKSTKNDYKGYYLIPFRVSYRFPSCQMETADSFTMMSREVIIS